MTFGECINVKWWLCENLVDWSWWQEQARVPSTWFLLVALVLLALLSWIDSGMGVLAGGAIAAIGGFSIARQEKKRTLAAMLIFIGALFAAINTYRAGREVLGWTTGGGSYAELLFDVQDSEACPGVTISLVGFYPLFDVRIEIDDEDERSSLLMSESRDDHLRALTGGFRHTLPVVLHPKRPLYIHRLCLPPDRDSARYTGRMVARNGMSIQDIRFRRVAGVWKLASRVRWQQFGRPPVPVGEDLVQEGFPVTQEGEVEW